MRSDQCYAPHCVFRTHLAVPPSVAVALSTAISPKKSSTCNEKPELAWLTSGTRWHVSAFKHWVPLTCWRLHFFLLTFWRTVFWLDSPSSSVLGISVASWSGMLSTTTSLLLFRVVSWIKKAKINHQSGKDSSGASHHEALTVTLSVKDKGRGQMSHGVKLGLFQVATDHFRALLSQCSWMCKNFSHVFLRSFPVGPHCFIVLLLESLACFNVGNLLVSPSLQFYLHVMLLFGLFFSI